MTILSILLALLAINQLMITRRLNRLEEKTLFTFNKQLNVVQDIMKLNEMRSKITDLILKLKRQGLKVVRTKAELKLEKIKK